MLKRKAYSPRRKPLKGLRLSCLSLLSLIATLSYALSPLELSAQLDSMPAIAGFSLRDADSGAILYQYQADKAFTPASNTKLLTATAALLVLGPNFTYETRLSTQPQHLSAHAINGDLYIQFSGDPSLNSQDLYALLQNLKRQGVTTIHGNVILDAGNSNTVTHLPLGSSIEDAYFCYGAVSIGTNLDHNCVTVKFTEHSPAPEIQDIDVSHIKVRSTLQWLTQDNAEQCTLDPQSDPRTNTLNLNGCLPPSLSTLSLAIPNPARYTLKQTQSLLRDLNISVSGQVLLGHTPASATHVIARHFSANLSHLIETMLKTSDNLYAAALTHSLGLKFYQQSNDKAGANAIKASLLNLKVSQFQLEDGAGFSRYNSISPNTLSLLLYRIYHQPMLANFIIPALPISGVDGTLAHFPSSQLRYKIKAKTGTMTGVNTLSGYLYLNHKVYIFSLMLNHVSVDTNTAHQVQAHFLETAAQQLSS